MADIELGQKVKTLDINLVQDCDFRDRIHRKDGTSWPDGISVVLDFTGLEDVTQWGAVVDGSTVSWAIKADEVNRIIGLRPRRARLLYGEPGVSPDEIDLVWAIGSVTITKVS